MPLAALDEARRDNPVAPLTFCLTLQLAVFDSVVSVLSTTTTVAEVFVVILCVPLLASLVAPVTCIKSPALALANVDAPAVIVLPLKDRVTLVLFTRLSPSK